MDFDSRIPISREPNSLSPLLNRDAMWQINLGSDDTIDGFGSYPERPGEPDCSYYIRTGLCRFGSTCRFNHPHDRKLVITSARVTGEEYPERIGQPECEYYIKTGTCKFGVTCKFDHPRNKAGIAGKVSLNVLGYPLRPNEDDCSYFLRTGQCKFGGTCKFNHPQSSNMMFSLRGSPVYPPVQSPTGQQWSRPSFPSSFPSLLLSQGVVPVQGWNTYSGQFGALSPSGSDHNYRNQQENEGKESGSPSFLSTGFHSSSMPLGFYALPRENVFPERPGQTECQFYMKTGDCKFGTVCKFHHPKDRQIPTPDCALSPVSLPLRPGEPLCVFYSRYGICKFGPSCKFDHPMRVFTYTNPSPLQPPHTTMPLLVSSSSSSPPMAAGEAQAEEVAEQSSGTEKARRVSVSETPSGQDNNSVDAEEQ